MRQERLAVGLDLVEGGDGGLQAGGLDGLQEKLLDKRVDIGQGEGLAAVVGVALGGMVADIGRGVGVMNVQQAPAAGANGDALEQG